MMTAHRLVREDVGIRVGDDVGVSSVQGGEGLHGRTKMTRAMSTRTEATVMKIRQGAQIPTTNRRTRCERDDIGGGAGSQTA